MLAALPITAAILGVSAIVAVTVLSERSPSMSVYHRLGKSPGDKAAEAEKAEQKRQQRLLARSERRRPDDAPEVEPEPEEAADPADVAKDRGAHRAGFLRLKAKEAFTRTDEEKAEAYNRQQKRQFERGQRRAADDVEDAAREQERAARRAARAEPTPAAAADDGEAEAAKDRAAKKAGFVRVKVKDLLTRDDEEKAAAAAKRTERQGARDARRAADDVEDAAREQERVARRAARDAAREAEAEAAEPLVDRQSRRARRRGDEAQAERADIPDPDLDDLPETVSGLPRRPVGRLRVVPRVTYQALAAM